MTRHSLPGYAQRLKAALDLQGWAMVDLAARVPPHYRLSKSTLDKIAQGQRQPKDWEWALLAGLLEVPEWFLREGFAGVPPKPEPDGSAHARQLERIESLLTQIADDLRTTSHSQPRSHTTKQTAEMLAISEDTLLKLVAEGEIEAFRLTNKLRFDETEIEDFKRRHAAQPKARVITARRD